MTTYNNINFDNTTDLREAINAHLASLSYPFAVKHKTYGDGQLVDAKAPTAGNSLFITVDFATCSKLLAVDTLLSLGLLTMPEDLEAIILEAQTAFKSDYEAVEKAKRDAKRLAYEQEKQALEDKKNEEKYEAAKAKMIKDFENMTKLERPLNTATEFATCIDWLANNCGAVSAAMPDYLLPYFQKQFGTSYEPRIVDSKKRTVNGNPMQWAISMTISIKKKAQDQIPAYLTQYLNKAGTAIADTSFIWDLVSHYGFQFGKTQDINQIRATIGL